MNKRETLQLTAFQLFEMAVHKRLREYEARGDQKVR